MATSGELNYGMYQGYGTAAINILRVEPTVSVFISAKRARKIMITPTVIPPVTSKPKSRNISLKPTKAVVIRVLMR